MKQYSKVANYGVEATYNEFMGAQSALQLDGMPPEVEWLLDPLSNRELDVLRLLSTGLTSTEIARELMLAVGTVRKHIKNIYSKLYTHHRLETVARARHLNLL